jgi:serine/threonine-protein kinase
MMVDLARRAHTEASVGGNPALRATWRPPTDNGHTMREEIGRETQAPQPPPPNRPVLGSAGPWELVDLVGHRLGTSHWLVRSQGTHGLLTWLHGTATRLGPAPDEQALRREQLERAARGLVGLAHPNLVRWLDYGVAGHGVYVVHELSDARSIYEAQADAWGGEHVLAPAAAARVGLDVARALMALHNSGQLHGAVNETTVFVSPSGSARLLPLGLEAPWYYGPRAHRFLSPEQARQNARRVESDLFQLGTLLYLLLSGRHPFDRDSDLETMDALVGRGESPPPLSMRVPQGLRELIARLLSPDLGARPTTAEEVLMELAMRSNLSMTAEPQSPAPESTDWHARAFELARLLVTWGPVTDRRD